MQRKEPSRPFRNIAGLIFAATLLSACLMEEEEAATDADVVTDHELTGSVGDGPVTGAAMRVVGRDGELIAEFESDAAASYSITVRTKGKHYPLLIDARNGTDLVTSLAPDFVLLGAVLEPGKKSVANVNPFSTFALEVAKELPDGISKTTLATGESLVVGTLSHGLSTLAVDGPMATPIDATNIAEIVKASEALGESVRRVRDLENAFGRPASGDSVVQAVASDLVDGVIDGRGGARVDARVSALMSVVSVQVLLESMQNELHVYGANATAAMNAAITRVAGGTVETTLADLTVTGAMLQSVDVGLDAIMAVDMSPKLLELAEAAAGLQAGMDPLLIQTLVPDDYRATLEAAILTIAGAGSATITTINDVVGSGGTEPPPPSTNNPPTISGTPSPSVIEGSSYTFAPTASDPDGDTLTYSISGQPTWTSFDTQTGALSGTPVTGDAGTYGNIVISVTDGEFTASLEAFTITVTEPVPTNSPPTISGTAAASVVEGDSYSFTPTASDPDGDTLTYSISGQPTWTSFDTQTGELSGMPMTGDAGTYANIVISVTDGELTASLPAFTITVTEPLPANSPPTISGDPATEINANSSYRFQPTAADPDGDALTFSIANKPAWASFDVQSGILSGTPTDADVGVYESIVISVTDSESASASLPAFSIAVNAVSLGSVTLSWTPPTQNEDGTALEDLAGYRIYWGTTPGVYTDSITLDNPGLTSYVVEGLAAGTYEFVATSFNAEGVESVYSNPATKVVQP